MVSFIRVPVELISAPDRGSLSLPSLGPEQLQRTDTGFRKDQVLFSKLRVFLQHLLSSWADSLTAAATPEESVNRRLGRELPAAGTPPPPLPSYSLTLCRNVTQHSGGREGSSSSSCTGTLSFILGNLRGRDDIFTDRTDILPPQLHLHSPLSKTWSTKSCF